MADRHCIVTFLSTHAALAAERAAKEAGIGIKMMTVPRRLSSDCNMGMKVATEDSDVLKELLESKGVDCQFTEDV